MTLIWFTRKPNLEMLDEIQNAGHQCLQTASEVEIHHLTAQYPQSLVIICDDIPKRRAKRIQQQYPTIITKANAKAKDLLIEVGQRIEDNA